MIYEFKLPDIGEGLTEGEVVRWHVKEGDAVRENQPLVNVLTDKAEVEIPSPKTGRIVRLMAKEGQKVQVGGILVAFEVAGSVSSSAASSLPPTAASKGVPAASNGGSIPKPAPTTDVNATPAVRKLAADLNVDLARIQGTGPGGRITEQDVRQAVQKPGFGIRNSGFAATNEPRTMSHEPRPFGPEERIPFTGIRRRTADKMSLSARTIPHVTHVDEADVTALVLLREELKTEAQSKGVKLTYLPFIIRALVKSLKQFPDLNASLDEAGAAIIRKKYYNIGIATATEHGLFVPVVKNADGKTVWELAGEIEKLAEKAKANKLDLSEIQGGTFTITNVGPVGGLFATPIILHPETAILGVMKIQKRPVVREGNIQARDMLNLSLSFDHRVLDGAEAALFTNTLIKHLENPRTLL